MRKRPRLRTWLTTSALAVTFTGAQAACGSETPLSLSPELSLSVEKTPRSGASEMSASSADEQDATILSKTLHTNAHLDPVQWIAMVDAAQRRMLRQIQWNFSLGFLALRNRPR